MLVLRQQKHEKASFSPFFDVRNSKKQYAGTGGHNLLRVITGRSRMRRARQLLRKKYCVTWPETKKIEVAQDISGEEFEI